MSIGIPCSPPFSRAFSFLSAKTYQGTFFVFSQNAPSKQFKSNVRETWRVILVSEADIFFTESLRILAERLSQSENGLPLRQICYYSPPEEVGVFSTEIKTAAEHLVFNGPCILRRILFHTWFTVCPSLSCFLFTQSAAYPRQSSLPAYLFAVKPYSAKKESASSVPR